MTLRALDDAARRAGRLTFEATAVKPPARLSDPAERIRRASIERLGGDHPIEIVGRSPAMQMLLERIEKIAPYDEPVLILGESGVGKESLSAAIHLLGKRCGKPFIPVNCPQYQEGNLTVSELFGHKKGSFTGAVADRKGCFETANGGVIFLDEIGDLHMSAQVMLLRALATGEFQPLGSEGTRRVDVRVVAATNRSLNELAADREFRRDLIFRLRHFLVTVPPLRERGDDWRLLLDHFLCNLHSRYGVRKRFAVESLRVLENYPWPGNVRELITITTTGYAMSDGDVILPDDFVGQLELERRAEQPHQTAESELTHIYGVLRDGLGDFWETVQTPFIERDLNRTQVRRLVARGLREAEGSYRRLLELWHLPADRYQKFMDFLRHHRLKPRGFSDAE